MPGENESPPAGSQRKKDHIGWTSSRPPQLVGRSAPVSPNTRKRQVSCC